MGTPGALEDPQFAIFKPTGRKAKWPKVVNFCPSVNICISETARRISFKLSGIVLQINLRRNYFSFFDWGPIGTKVDDNGIIAPFAKFLKICLVTFLISRIKLPQDVHEGLDSIEPLEGGPGSRFGPSEGQNNGNFHTFCQLSQNLFSNFFCFAHVASLGCHLSAIKN